ncbi:Uncharacterised protein [uncultured archaeon]|nr:Uncharacterised protein [uncultured archaeon]
MTRVENLIAESGRNRFFRDYQRMITDTTPSPQLVAIERTLQRNRFENAEVATEALMRLPEFRQDPHAETMIWFWTRHLATRAGAHSSPIRDICWRISAHNAPY